MPTAAEMTKGIKPTGKLSTKKRSKLPKSTFGLPGSRKYPMPDKSHAANAKARATQMEKRGKLSASAKASIDAKANRILGRKS
ncbi:MAG: hypothetical protein WBE74_02235 [Terracidiphilus sp.]